MDKLEKLIQEIREHEVLYNPNHEDYRNLILKASIWEEIANNCGMRNGNEAKTEWKKLRDRFRNVVQRRKSKNGKVGKKFVRSWPYWDQMQFIRNTDDGCEDRSPETYNESTDIENKVQSIWPLESEYSELPNHITCEYLEYPKRKPKRDMDLEKSKPVKKRRENTNTEEIVSNLLKHKYNIQADRERGPPDALKIFFDSIYETCRTLPPNIIRQVKRDVLSIINDAEQQAAEILQATH